MTGITLELTTAHIQLLDIAVLLRDTTREDPEWTEMYNDLQAVLGELNSMCNEGNNYTLTIEVTA